MGDGLLQAHGVAVFGMVSLSPQFWAGYALPETAPTARSPRAVSETLRRDQFRARCEI
jgi:hypothetical protein